MPTPTVYLLRLNEPTLQRTRSQLLQAKGVELAGSSHVLADGLAEIATLAPIPEAERIRLKAQVAIWLGRGGEVELDRSLSEKALVSLGEGLGLDAEEAA